MRKVIIDENLPRAFGQIFQKFEFEALDIRDNKLRGAPDSTIFNFAVTRRAALATSDVFFAQHVHRFEPKHHGVFLIRLPSFLSVELRCRQLSQALEKVSSREIENSILVITPNSVRVQTKQ